MECEEFTPPDDPARPCLVMMMMIRSRESLGEESSSLVRRGSVRVKRSQEKADSGSLRRWKIFFMTINDDDGDDDYDDGDMWTVQCTLCRSNSLVDATAARRAIVRQQFSQETS